MGGTTAQGPAPTFGVPGRFDPGPAVFVPDASDSAGAAISDGVGETPEIGASQDAEASAADTGGATAETSVGGGSDAALSMLDLDLDGFSPMDGDCDDEDKAIFPSAPEVCDAKDNDCDGKADNIDGDGDGHSPCAGAQPDCDDSNAKVFPGAQPDCANGLDNNCDGTVDGTQTADQDSDGFNACQDCDDADAKIFPGAAKSCENAKDNDCNGVIDAAEDGDKDGFSGCVDCDDLDPKAFPLAPELCNGKDDDCTGLADDLDLDGDGWNACGGGDCDDGDIGINPQSAPNCKNGKDNNCNGVPDSQEDFDKDGFVGCADCDDSNPAKNSNAWELPSDLVDNDCDGSTDEVGSSCDVAPMADGKPEDYVRAIDLCVPTGSTIVSSSAFPVLAAGSARAIKNAYGPPNKPLKGKHFVVLSSGNAAAKGQSGYVLPQPGTSFSNTAPYPPVACNASGSVNDFTEWKLTLKVPGNVNGLSFQFNFMSAEYPEWVGTQFNDKFVAVLDSKKFKGNISFDEKGSCVSINNAFFTVCSGCTQGDAGLQGTGFEGNIGGGTGWLTTTSPVEPGETITLRFIVFDEGDRIYDSSVLLDNFRWEVLTNGETTPSTVRPGG